MPLVDFHSHYGASFFRYRKYRMDIDSLLRGMDEHDIATAVVGAAGEFAAYYCAEGNRQIAEAVAVAPGRLIGFANVNPWMRGEALDELRRAREMHGLRGLVLHPILQGYEANDPLVLPLVELAVSLNMPVYVTGGAPFLAMPYKIADLAGRYPQGRFILGHAGWDFHFDVIYCMQACPNLVAETSKNGLANLEALIRSCGAERLLFGSDHPFSSYEAEIEKIRLLPGLDDAARDLVLRGNAARLLGLERPA